MTEFQKTIVSFLSKDRIMDIRKTSRDLAILTAGALSGGVIAFVLVVVGHFIWSIL
jgi:hypothetical protein